MMKHFIKYIIYFNSILIVFALLTSPGICEEGKNNTNKITHVKVDENTFKLSIVLAGTSNPADGQELLLPIAEQLCGSEEFHLGKYTFKTQRGLEDSNNDELVFSQEVHCGQKEALSKPKHAIDPNWQPSDEVKQEAVDTVDIYMQTVNEEKYTEAYKMLSSGMQNLSTREEWSQYQVEFQKTSGGDALYTNVRVTWYKDPEGAAAPGIYAAFDIECKYKNINICDEVIILHKQNADPFRVMRHERNYIDKETEVELIKQKLEEMDESEAI